MTICKNCGKIIEFGYWHGLKMWYHIGYNGNTNKVSCDLFAEPKEVIKNGKN